MALPIRVLVVDDSVFVRRVLVRILEEDPDFHVVGTAADGQEALQKVLALQPDVVTMDVEMPRMDGLAALKEIMVSRPTPVVMVSSLTGPATRATVRALSLGAVEVVAKPSGSGTALLTLGADLRKKVRLAASAAMHHLSRLPRPDRSAGKGVVPSRADAVVVVAASTGGPRALGEVIPRLPADLPASVLVVQHMPPGFTRALADRLNDTSSLPVREAGEGDTLQTGTVLVAQAGHHLVVEAGGSLRLDDSPPRHGVRPAADVTLESAARLYGRRTLGVVLTGMGLDGALGLLEIRRAGGHTLAESPETAVIYGMPRAAVEVGAVEEVLPLYRMAERIQELASGWKKDHYRRD